MLSDKNALSEILHIAVATDDELRHISQLEAQCFPENPINLPHLRRLFKSSSVSIFIAQQHDTLVGYTILFTPKNTHKARIFSLAVHPNWQRKGVALALIAHLETYAKSINKKGLTLEVQTLNSAAMALYYHCNFVEKGVYHNFYAPGRHAALLVKEW